MSTSLEVIDPATGEILPVEQTPAQFLEGAREMARLLSDVVKQQRLDVEIQGKRYIKLEGWQFLAAMCHLTPRTREITELHEDGRSIGVRVYVELVRDSDLAILGGSYGRCDYSERIARNGRYAAESMAVTRATSKAISQKLRFIPVLAGYVGTPAEEMVLERNDPPQPRQPRGEKWKSNPDADQAPDDPNFGADSTGSAPKPVAAAEKVSEVAASRPEAEGGAAPKAATGNPSEPHWLDDALPGIQSRPNWKGKSWRWMTLGKRDGDRHKWLNAVLDNPQASKSLKLRCEYCVIVIESRA